MILVDFLLEVSMMVASMTGFIGVAIITYGGLRSVYLFIQCALRRKDSIAIIRLEFGKYLTLGLEFLIGKDVIETIVEPSWDELGKLACIVVIRTIITIFLSWELKDAEEEIRLGFLSPLKRKKQ